MSIVRIKLCVKYHQSLSPSPQAWDLRRKWQGKVALAPRSFSAPVSAYSAGVDCLFWWRWMRCCNAGCMLLSSATDSDRMCHCCASLLFTWRSFNAVPCGSHNVCKLWSTYHNMHHWKEKRKTKMRPSSRITICKQFAATSQPCPLTRVSTYHETKESK